MSISKKLLISLTVAAAAITLAPASGASAMSYDSSDDNWHESWSQTCEPGDENQQASEQSTLVDTLAADGRFTTLIAAVQAAGLVDAVNSADQKTVFAPTDDAFAALPEGTVESLLANPAALANILTYHVVSGRVDANTALDVGEATTLNGQMVNIGYGGDVAYVNDSRLVETDIEASNGIIHVIDSVLMPQ